MREEPPRKRIIIEDVDVAHSRLVELTLLADKAKPFYDWVEQVFQRQLNSTQSLERLLQSLDKAAIAKCIRWCYEAGDTQNVPLLFDGVGRSYPHQKACYYFFSWLVRDAPQQRLNPLIARMRKVSGRNSTELQMQTIAELLFAYRGRLQCFTWEAIREVIIDRLEGSRRSIKGHENEVIVRTALLSTLQGYYQKNQNYGMYRGVEVAAKQIKVGNETFDISVRLLAASGEIDRSIFVPVKTRETEGGGHAHLFTRDITAAIETARTKHPHDFVVVIIVAQNWSNREKETVRALVDHAAIFDLSPNNFEEFSTFEQQQLDTFIGRVLRGEVTPRKS